MWFSAHMIMLEDTLQDNYYKLTEWMKLEPDEFIKAIDDVQEKLENYIANITKQTTARA